MTILFPSPYLHIEFTPFLVPVAISNLTTLPTWTGAVNAGTRSQLIYVPIVFPALFCAHMTDVDCSVTIVHVDLRDEFGKESMKSGTAVKEAFAQCQLQFGGGVTTHSISTFLLSPLCPTAEKEKHKANM